VVAVIGAAVFQSLLGVIKVEQGYVESIGDNSSFSEAVIVYFNSDEISVKTLIEIHLHTHKSTSNHSMRHKYRSAVYTFSEVQKQEVEQIIATFQELSEKKLITQVLTFQNLKLQELK
jgi:peptide-methionine (S)-S-oxide reductase